MIKKLISLLTVFVLIFTVATFSVSAAEPEDNIGIMTTDELYDYELDTLGTIVYPSWSNFNSMTSVLPKSVTVSGYTYNFDRFFVFFANSGVDSNDNFNINCILWDSSHFNLYWRSNSASKYNFSATDLDGLSRGGLFGFVWDSSTSSWSSYLTSADEFSFYQTRGIYSNGNITNASGTTVLYDFGPSDEYSAFLIDDPDYNGDIVDDGSNGGFSSSEKNLLFNWLEKIWTSINNLSSSIGSYFSDLGNYIGGKLDQLISFFEDDNSGSTTGRNFFDMIADIVDAIASIPGEIAKEIANVVNSITTMTDNIVSSITTMADNIVSSITTCISDVIKTLTDFFDSFFENLFSTIENVLTTLFVPSDGFFDNSVTDFKARLPFIGVISDFTDSVFNYIQTESYADAPAITVDLSLAEGKYNYGLGHVTVLDLSWYGRFKPYVDMFLSAFLWITYLWLLYKRLPDIIAGAGMATEMSANFSGVNVEYEQAKYRYHYRRDRGGQ